MLAESEYPEFDPQLELKDRINYPHILTTSIIAMKSSIRETKEFNLRKVQIMILDLLTDIPDTWKDEEFELELKKVVKIRNIDVRPVNAGVRLSTSACKRMGIQTIRQEKQINYFRLKNAIINLLDRRHLLIRKEKIEQSTGRNLDIQFIEELERDVDEE